MNRVVGIGKKKDDAEGMELAPSSVREWPGPSGGFTARPEGEEANWIR
jgi:hypothetical protein